MTGGRLPDGTETNSNKVYIDTWRKLAEPLEKMTGLEHIAFDPGVQFSSGEKIITLPVWFLELLNNYYRENSIGLKLIEKQLDDLLEQLKEFHGG